MTHAITNALNTNDARSYWDPIEGNIYASIDPAFDRQARSYFPYWVSKWISALGLPIGLLGFVVGTLAHFMGNQIWMFIGIGAFSGSIALILLTDHLSGGKQKSLNTLKRAADKLKFQARAKIPDEKLRSLRSVVSEFFELKVASAIPLHIESELWGTSKKDQVPLWIGLSLIDSFSVLAGPQAQTVGKQGSNFGQCLMFITAYDLARDTGVRVQLFPEYKTPLGPLDIDIQTESVEFNRKYNIRLHSDTSQSKAEAMSAQLLQILTPAFQATLIDLADRFATRIIIDGKSVFFAGYHNLVSNKQSELDGMLGNLLEELSDAAVSFKKFAE